MELVLYLGGHLLKGVVFSDQLPQKLHLWRWRLPRAQRTFQTKLTNASGIKAVCLGLGFKSFGKVLDLIGEHYNDLLVMFA